MKLSKLQQQVYNQERERDALPKAELSEAEKAYLRIQQQFEPPPPAPNYKLAQNEKLAIFLSLKDQIKSGVDADIIARNCVQAMEEFMDEKIEHAKNPTAGKKGVFRRVT